MSDSDQPPATSGKALTGKGLAKQLERLRDTSEAAPVGTAFTCGPPWFRHGSGVLVGSPDPHAGHLVADTDTSFLRDDEGPPPDWDDDAIAAFLTEAWNFARLILSRPDLIAALRSAGPEGGETQGAGTSSPKPPRGGPVETRPRSGAKILAGLKDVLAFTKGDTDRAELRTFAVRDGAVVEVEPGSPGGKPIADVFRGALAEAKDALAQARAAEAAEEMRAACLRVVNDQTYTGAGTEDRNDLIGMYARGCRNTKRVIAKRIGALPLSAFRPRTTDGGEA